jgi:hypothetical protein
VNQRHNTWIGRNRDQTTGNQFLTGLKQRSMQVVPIGKQLSNINDSSSSDKDSNNNQTINIPRAISKRHCRFNK